MLSPYSLICLLVVCHISVRCQTTSHPKQPKTVRWVVENLWDGSRFDTRPAGSPEVLEPKFVEETQMFTEQLQPPTTAPQPSSTTSASLSTIAAQLITAADVKDDVVPDHRRWPTTQNDDAMAKNTVADADVPRIETTAQRPIIVSDGDVDSGAATFLVSLVTLLVAFFALSL